MNLKELAEIVANQGTAIGALQEELALLKGQMAIVDDLNLKVNSRNRSAAAKRNMTDSDALRVLTGDMKDLSHKEAAEEMSLTYAQIYSCRLEFTFKHVHKDLRDAGWKNPWAKG